MSSVMKILTDRWGGSDQRKPDQEWVSVLSEFGEKYPDMTPECVMQYLIPEGAYVYVEVLQRINRISNAVQLMKSGLGELELLTILDIMGKAPPSKKRQPPPMRRRRGSTPISPDAVRTSSMEEDRAMEANPEVCQKCKGSTEGDRRVLLCDGCDPSGRRCDKEYHYSCLGIKRKPSGKWYGPCCREEASSLPVRQQRNVGRRTPNFSASQLRTGPKKKQQERQLHSLLTGSEEFPARNEMHIKHMMEEGVDFVVNPLRPLEDKFEESKSLFDSLTRLPEGFGLTETKSKNDASKFTGYQLNRRIDHTKVDGGIVFNPGNIDGNDPNPTLHLGKFVCKHMAILVANLMQQFLDEHKYRIEVQCVNASTMMKYKIQDGLEKKEIELIDNFEHGKSKRCNVCYEALKAYCGVSEDVKDGQRSTSPFQGRFLNGMSSEQLEGILCENGNMMKTYPPKPEHAPEVLNDLQNLYNEAFEDFAGSLM